MSHTINVSDFTNQDALHQILSEIQNHGTSYALVQDGIEVAQVVPVEDKVVPVEEENDMSADELWEHRRRVMDEVEEFSKRIAHLWSTDETSAEAVANNRR